MNIYSKAFSIAALRGAEHIAFQVERDTVLELAAEVLASEQRLYFLMGLMGKICTLSYGDLPAENAVSQIKALGVRAKELLELLGVRDGVLGERYLEAFGRQPKDLVFCCECEHRVKSAESRYGTCAVKPIPGLEVLRLEFCVEANNGRCKEYSPAAV